MLSTSPGLWPGDPHDQRTVNRATRQNCSAQSRRKEHQNSKLDLCNNQSSTNTPLAQRPTNLGPFFFLHAHAKDDQLGQKPTHFLACCTRIPRTDLNKKRSRRQSTCLAEQSNRSLAPYSAAAHLESLRRRDINNSAAAPSQSGNQFPSFPPPPQKNHRPLWERNRTPLPTPSLPPSIHSIIWVPNQQRWTNGDEQSSDRGPLHPTHPWNTYCR